MHILQWIGKVPVISHHNKNIPNRLLEPVGDLDQLRDEFSQDKCMFVMVKNREWNKISPMINSGANHAPAN